MDGEICSLDAGPVPDAAPVINEEDEWYNRLPDSDEYVTGPVYDSNTGVEFDAEKGKLARMEELAWMKRQKIYIPRFQSPKRMQQGRESYA